MLRRILGEFKRKCPRRFSPRHVPVARPLMAVAMLEHASPRVFLGQLKSLFELPELVAPGDITPIWALSKWRTARALSLNVRWPE